MHSVGAEACTPPEGGRDGRVTVLLWILGLLCVAIVVIDLLWTIMAAGAGGGPLTSALADRLWSALPRGDTRAHHRLLQVAGVGVTVTIVFVWFLLLIAGWTLVFNASPDAVVHSGSGQPADVWARLYFTGFTVFTLGIGDYVPGDGVWQMMTVLATGSGLSLVTLAITYMLSVTSSVTQRRQLASQIAALGKSPVTILERAWDGQEFQGLEDQLRTLSSQVSDLGQRQLAFPALHYFHSVHRENAVAPGIAVLDELLTVLEHGVIAQHQLPQLTTRAFRDTITELLRTVTTVFEHVGTDSAQDPPPTPDLTRLRRAGIPLRSDAEWEAAVAEHAERRRTLEAFLVVDGWPWDSVWHSGQV